MIERTEYLEKLKKWKDKDLIKVVTGIRRCGKSTLFELFIEYLKTIGIEENHIISINLENPDNDFENYKDFYKFVKQQIKDEKQYYIFLDEVQNVPEFQKAVDGLYILKNVDVYITGSNAYLLSGELATLLSGRYVSFKIRPFSFKEVCEFNNYELDKYKLEKEFNDYIKWGGLPQRFNFKSEDEIRIYLTDVYNSIVVKDIIKRFNIGDIELFNRISEYVSTTPSQTFSAENLVKYFEINDDRGVTKNTLYNYLEYMCKAHLIEKVDRYDVRGKRILNGKYKYYLTDLGLGQILNVSKREQMGAYLENVVYNELVYRGYDVKVGNLEKGEIDFIALKNGNKEYYQVCYYLTDDKVIDREFNVYNNIKDNYPKYVISMDKFDMSQNGIIHKNIIDWLLED